MPLTLPWKKGFLSGFDRRGESGISTQFRVPSLFQKIVFLVALLLFAGLNTYAANRYSVATGNWNNTATWSASSGGAPGASVPAAGDVVTVEGGFTVTLNVNSANLGSLTISAGSTLSATGTSTLTIAGAMVVNGTYTNGSSGLVTLGSMTVNAAATYNHNTPGTIPTAVWASTSNCNITGITGALPAGVTQNFGNLTWNCAGQTANIFPTVNIQGTLNVVSTNGFEGRPTDGATNSIGGDYNHSGGIVRWTRNLAGSLTVNGNTNITGGEVRLSNGTGNLTLNAKGDFEVSGSGSLTETGTAAGCTVFFNGSTVQTYTSGGVPGVSQTVSFNVSGGTTLQMADATTIVTGSGSFTLSSGATLGVTSANGITVTASGAVGNIQVTGTRTYTAGANYIYNGTTNQAVGNGLTQNTPANLTISNPGNTVSLGAATTLSAALTITAGTLDANGQTLSASGLTTVNGTYLTSTATQNLNGGLTISGGTLTGSTGTLNTTDVNLSGGALTAPSGSFSVSGNWTKSGGTFTPGVNTVTFTGAGTQSLNSGGSPFNNIVHSGTGTLQLITNSLNAAGTFGNTSGIFSANGQTHTAAGLVTVSGGTYQAGTATQTFNGGLTISGGTFTGSSGDVTTTTMTLSSGTLTAPSGAFSVSGNWNKSGGTFTPGSNTVTFTGTGAQTLASGGTAFNNIAHTGAGTLQLTTNALSTGGTFTNSAGTFDANGLTNTVTGSATVSGGTYLASTATQTFNGGLTISGGTFTGSTGSVSSTDVTISSGTLTAPSGTFSVSGNWLRSGGTFTPGANTVTFTGTGTQTLNSGGASFTNISHTGNGTLQLTGSSLSANGTLANSAGTIDANGQVATISGLTTLAGGSYLASTATQNFSGGLTVSGGTLTGSAGDVNVSDVTLSSGTLTAPSANLNVSGNWSNNGGTFSNNNGTANFSGSAKSIGGSQLSTFYNLNTSGTASITTAAPVTVTNNLVVASGTSLSIGGFATSVAGTTTVGGGTLNIASSSGAKTFSGLVTLQPGSTWNNSGNSPVTFQGGITRTSGAFTAGTGLYTFDTNSQSLSGTYSIPSVDVSGVSLTNNNNLTIATALGGSGSLTQAVGATLTIQGTSSISSINASNNGNTVIFNGNAQTVNTGTYYNLTINETGGTDATLGGAVGVDGTLTFTTGKTLLGANNLTLGSSATISGGASSATMIVASSSGQIKKTYSGSGSFTFPIGDNTAVYSPVSVNVTAGSFPLDIAANVVKAKHPNNASATNYLNRYWNITPSASATATVTGTYVAGDVNGTEASASAGQLNGTFNQNTNPWTKFGALGGLTLTAPGATLTSGQTSAFTGITGANPTAAITGGGVTICSGGSVNLGTTVTGDPTIVYSWSPSSGLSSTTIANPVANPSATTVYTVSIRDGNGILTTSAPSTVTVNPVLSVTATTPDNLICENETTSLLATPSGGTPGYSYAWTGAGVAGLSSATIANPVFTPLDITVQTVYVFTVTVTDAATCTAVNTVSVTVNPVPNNALVVSAASGSICNGASTTIDVAGSEAGVNYQLRNNTGNIPIGPLVAGTGGVINLPTGNLTANTTFNVLATNATTGCYTQLSTTVTVTVNPTP
ncbi:MAG: hypothetical protein JST46_13850, partial [Bacteroidetes bacterium]|nr:hypothetical protein [Bacteroidota bacterium]